MKFNESQVGITMIVHNESEIISVKFLNSSVTVKSHYNSILISRIYYLHRETIIVLRTTEENCGLKNSMLFSFFYLTPKRGIMKPKNL